MGKPTFDTRAHTAMAMIFSAFLLLGAPLDPSGAQAQEGAEVIDRIVAVVNNDIIPLFELNQALQPYADRIRAMNYSPEQERQMLFKVREDLLRQLIDQKLTDQEIKRVNITVTPQEIDNSIERVKEASFLTDEDLRQSLAQEGLTFETYRERLEKQILRSKLVNREIKSKIVITSEDVKAYYENHIEKYAGHRRYHLRNIIMTVPSFADEGQKREVRTQLEAVYEQLKAGASFEALARTHSQGPVADQGGDLGVFELQDLALQIRDAVQSLQAGEFTPVLDTDMGYQLFYVQEILQGAGKSLEEVAGEIENQLYQEIVDDKFIAWLEELRQRSHIKIIK